MRSGLYTTVPLSDTEKNPARAVSSISGPVKTSRAASNGRANTLAPRKNSSCPAA